MEGYYEKSFFLLFFTPLIFFLYLCLFIFCEIVFNVECFTNLLWCFTFDHICNCFACNIKQAFYIQVIGSQYKFKQGSLINLEKFLIPDRYIICSFFLIFVIFRWKGIIFVLCAPLNNFS